MAIMRSVISRDCCCSWAIVLSLATISWRLTFSWALFRSVRSSRMSVLSRSILLREHKPSFHSVKGQWSPKICATEITRKYASWTVTKNNKNQKNKKSSRSSSSFSLSDMHVNTGPIIIAFKGAIWDFLPSHSAVNCLQVQHVCSSGPGAIMCKSRATHRALITCKCHFMCHLEQRDSSAIKSDRVEIAFIWALLYWLNH